MKKKLFLLPFVFLSILCLGFVNSQTVYCKYCGRSFPSVKSMASASACYKTSSEKHIPYDGVIQDPYQCLWCGRQHKSLMAMAQEKCHRNPFGETRHEPYEGSKKTQYECKDCGMLYPTLQAMSAARCNKSPIHRHCPRR